jgi:DNA-binding PadR family transcriptional regulator
MASVSRTGTLGYALLGHLAQESLTGYELKGRIERRTAHYFSAHLSQIYPELRRLKSKGWVDFKELPQKRARPKKLYRLTPAGRGALKEWAGAPPTPPPPRLELLVKTQAVWLAEPKLARAMYEAEARMADDDLVHFEEAQGRIKARHGGKPPLPHHPDFGDWANLAYGLGNARAVGAWCRWIVGELQKR